MATQLSLLKSFVDGQGGGIATYTTYPADHDTNYGDIESTVNQLVNEVAAARVLDVLLPQDLAVSDDIADNNSSIGRMSPWEARVTRSTTLVTITSGRILVNGTRVDVTGTTFGSTRANGLWYVACDQAGLLSFTTTASSAFVDLASVTVATNLFTTPNTDLLAVNTQRTPLISANTTNAIYHRTDFLGVNVGNASPAIRCVNSAGTLEDAGFSHSGTPSQFSWISQKDGGEATGSSVLAASFHPKGQMLLREQARFQITFTGTAYAIVTGTWSDVRWDLLPGTNVEGDPERFEPEAYTASTAWQSGTNNINVLIPTGYDGTWLITGFVTLENAGTANLVESRIWRPSDSVHIGHSRVGPSASGDTIVNVTGMYDLAGGDLIQMEIRHDVGADRNLLSARICGMLIGGIV